MALITVPAGIAGAAGAGGAGAGVGGAAGAGFAAGAAGAGAGVVDAAAPLFEAGAPLPVVLLVAVLLVSVPGAAADVVLPEVGEAVVAAGPDVALALLAATGDELELRPPQAIVASIKPAISIETEIRNNLRLLNFRFWPSGGRAIWALWTAKRNRDHNRDQVNYW